MSDEVKTLPNEPNGLNTHLLWRTWYVTRLGFDLVAAMLTFSLALSTVVGIYALLGTEVSHAYLSIVSVIAGITTMLFSVSVVMWLKEKARRNTIKKIRDRNKPFFEQVEKDITSLVGGKVH